MDLFPTIPDEFVVMTLTDIPYGVVNRQSNGLRELDKSYADQSTFEIEPFVKEIVRVTSGSVYIFCGTEQVSGIRKLMVDLGLSTRLCILEKKNPSPLNGQHLWLSSIECCVYGKKKGATFNEHCKSPVWRYPVERKIGHLTPKPLKLCQYLIETSSNIGDTILDPCAGSGTTLLAAKNTGRNYIGIELREDSVAVCKERLDQ